MWRAKGGDARQHRHHGVLANPADGELPRERIRLAIVKSRREIVDGFVDTGRPEQVGRGDNEAAVRDPVVVIEDAAELVAQGRFASKLEREFLRHATVRVRGLVGEIDPGRVGAWSAIERVESALRFAQLRGQ